MGRKGENGLGPGGTNGSFHGVLICCIGGSKDVDRLIWGRLEFCILFTQGREFFLKEG